MGGHTVALLGASSGKATRRAQIAQLADHHLRVRVVGSPDRVPSVHVQRPVEVRRHHPLCWVAGLQEESQVRLVPERVGVDALAEVVDRGPDEARVADGVGGDPGRTLLKLGVGWVHRRPAHVMTGVILTRPRVPVIERICRVLSGTDTLIPGVAAERDVNLHVVRERAVDGLAEPLEVEVPVGVLVGSPVDVEAHHPRSGSPDAAVDQVEAFVGGPFAVAEGVAADQEPAAIQQPRWVFEPELHVLPCAVGEQVCLVIGDVGVGYPVLGVGSEVPRRARQRDRDVAGERIASDQILATVPVDVREVQRVAGREAAHPFGRLERGRGACREQHFAGARRAPDGVGGAVAVTSPAASAWSDASAPHASSPVSRA